MYEPVNRRTPHHTNQLESLGKKLETTPGPRLSPHSCLGFDRVKQGGHRRPSVVEDSCIAMLPDPPRREQDQRRGPLAKRARDGSYNLHPLVREVAFNKRGSM
jgi:hypothetical protein